MSFADREKRFSQIEEEKRIVVETQKAQELKIKQDQIDAIREHPIFKEMMALAQDPELREALERNWERGGKRKKYSEELSFGDDPFKINIYPSLRPEPNQPLGFIMIVSHFYEGMLQIKIVFREKPEKSVTTSSRYGVSTHGTDAEAGIALEIGKVCYSMDELLDYIAEGLSKGPGRYVGAKRDFPIDPSVG